MSTVTLITKINITRHSEIIERKVSTIALLTGSSVAVYLLEILSNRDREK